MVPTVPPLVVIMTQEVNDLLSSSSFSPSSWEVVATDALLLPVTKLPPTYVQTDNLNSQKATTYVANKHIAECYTILEEVVHSTVVM